MKICDWRKFLTFCAVVIFILGVILYGMTKVPHQRLVEVEEVSFVEVSGNSSGNVSWGD